MATSRKKDQQQLHLRLPKPLYEQLVAEALTTSQSVNAVVVDRLQASLPGEKNGLALARASYSSSVTNAILEETNATYADIIDRLSKPQESQED